MASNDQANDEAKVMLGGTVTKIEGERPDSDAALLGTNALEVDDEFVALYEGANGEGTVLAPPYNPKQLKKLVEQNNTLGQCVDAYESSIDGTGFLLQPKDGTESDDSQKDEIAGIMEFFDEPYPGESFLSQRKGLRRDLESTGVAYLEVIRNPQKEIVFTRRMESEYVRKMRLGQAVPTTLTLRRNGTEKSVRTTVRYRRYIQKVGNVTTYFKEFGCELDLNKRTGEWAESGKQLPYNQRASEIIEFGVNESVGTAYHVPRWINQLPSVLGSRQAEEFNLDFFYAGGMPPALIMISGGSMHSDTRKALEAHFHGKKNQSRAAIVELFSTGGSLDKDSVPSVKVERFGSEQQKDSMFENYDMRCEERVRRGFRLPPLFAGKADAYNYATAVISYVVAEQQVFAPERIEFDQTINNTLMREIAPGYEFKSKGLTLKDIQTQMKAIGIAADKGVISGGQLVTSLNETAGTNLNVHEDIEDQPLAQSRPASQTTPAEGEGDDEGDTATKSEGTDVDLPRLVRDWSNYMTGYRDFELYEVAEMESTLKSLSGKDKDMFESALAASMMDLDYDPEGMSELIGCLCSGGTHAH